MTTDTTDTTSLSIEDVSVRLSGTDIVSDVSLIARSGEITGIVGPNGSGKSTLLRTVYRHLEPVHGRIIAGERDLLSLSATETARIIASVPQERESAFGITAREVVALGRIPHQGSFRRQSAQDRAAIDEALAEVGLTEKAHRTFQSLSGGERQRVLLARCFAQSAQVYVLDEPTNHLDLAHQAQLLTLLRRRRHTCLLTVHDLGLAAAICDSLHVLSNGRIVVSGRPRDILTPDLLHTVFGVRAEIGVHPRTGGLHIVVDYLAGAR